MGPSPSSHCKTRFLASSTIDPTCSRVRSRRSTPGHSRPMSANSYNSLGSARNLLDEDLVLAIGNR